jgi:hypothetical protein
VSKNGSKELQKSLKNQQRIEVGDLVYLGSDIESGPIGIVLREILVSSKERWYSRDFELGPFGDEQKIKLPDRREYYCSMIGKNGKVINMVFSENDLVIISKGVKLLNEEVLI